MTEMTKTVWRKNFSIPKVHLEFAYETVDAFVQGQKYTIGRNVLKQGFWVIKNLENVGTYFPQKELRAIVLETLNEIVRHPNKIDRLHAKTTQLHKDYFRFAKPLTKLNLIQKSDKELVKLYNDLYIWQYLSHGRGLLTTWFVDSDGEDFSLHLFNILKKRIAEGRPSMDLAESFSVLTTLGRKSMAQEEEEDSYGVYKALKRNKKARTLFRKPLSKIAGGIDELPPSILQKIHAHCQKWRWLPYTYIGPAYDLNHYLETWKNLFAKKFEPDKKLVNERKLLAETMRKRKEIVKALALTNHEKHLFDIAAEIIWLKGFRKDCYFHGMYALDFITSEIGRRVGMTSLEVKYLLPEEISQIFKDKSLAKIARQRMKFSIIYATTKDIKVLAGKQAHSFLKKQKLEKVAAIKASEIKGQCAYPGSGKGEVKVINVPEDMKKMEQGNVMVAHATYPALLPAMKKASAIITEEGGITCHAAIVAREMRIPCIVGTKIAASVLKDGDIVQFDTGKGIVKKLN